jgi:hypothetical protein
MGWERRGSATYYYRSRRVNGRVVNEYFGSGLLGELVAQQDAQERAKRAADTAAWKAERDRLEAADAPLQELDALVSLLTRGVLLAAGYHRHHREWRKKRA